ncbi:MAG TPA: nuclear transport factor 2 family protein [Ignavibacteria bacterium]|nr:nuclear transport factor 2 family protein [Ignavibacteria bacterium]
MKVLKTAISFLEKINKHDINGISELMSPDHEFMDSMGIIVKGKKGMIKAWKGFFSWFPDYEITAMNTLLTDDSVGFFGVANGTFNNEKEISSNKFTIPASWRAKVKDGLITEWQVFADNEVVRNILTENGRKAIIKEHIARRIRR